MGLLSRLFRTRSPERDTPPAESGVEEPLARAGPTRPEPTGPETARDEAAVERLREGLARHQDGDLARAEGAYREALSLVPQQPDAHYLLGSLLGASGRLDEALTHLQEAARLDPSSAATRADIGNVHHARGRLDLAEAAYREAIALDPDLADAHRNLGNLLRASERTEEAIDALAQACALAPGDADTHFARADLLSSVGRHEDARRDYVAGLEAAPDVALARNNLGATLRRLSRDDEAVACFEAALRIDPGLGDAHANLAEVLHRRGSPDAAAEHYRAAIALTPDILPLQRGLAQLLLEQERVDDALRCYAEILALDPGSARSHHELGTALVVAARLDDAIERLSEASRLDPRDAGIQINLGCALNEAGRFEPARQCFSRAVALDPDLVEAHNNLGGVLQLQGELHAAMRSYERALALAPELLHVWSNYLTCMNYDDDALAEEVFAQHRRYAEVVAGTVGKVSAARVHNPDPDRRLRIGYVSADLRYHSVAFFLAPLLEHHDREQFEVTGYANVAKPDDNTRRLQAMCDRWRDVAALDDAEIAAWVRRDEIDLLVDLSGQFVGNRLPVFAARPAPIQVTYLGYPNTTGLATMDYRLTDSLADPIGPADALHSEELVRLEEGFLCFEPLATCPAVRQPRPGRSGQGVTFASFNELLKITPTTIAMWCEILARSPDSKLIVKGTTLADEGTRQRVLARFVERGADPARIELIGRTRSLEEHLELYNSVDIGLDTFPYNGTTTTCEALWMGVPVISRCGDVHASRVGLSLLHHVGLEDLVSDSAEAYVSAALALAADGGRRGRLHDELRERLRGSALMDAPQQTRRIESAFREMWRRACGAAADRGAHGTAGDETMTVTIADGNSVCVPARFDELTPYVLVEQEDWFEDEIRFVRKLLEPGMRCLDIGANFGLFSLGCAVRVGPDGHVWSFEPTPSTAAYLARSIEQNAHGNISLVRAALSLRSGTAKLITHADSEHNYLADEVSLADGLEIVDVTSLDEFASQHGLEGIDFIKMDAEGAEIAILEGGKAFLERESPVVLFEIKHGEGVNWDLIAAMRARGFDLFMLAPGLQALVPFDPDDVDAFQLDLFAVPPDRAGTLEARGLLVRTALADAQPGAAPADAVDERLADLPYAKDLLLSWGREEVPSRLRAALGLYCRATDSSLPVARRHHALRAACALLSQPAEGGADNARLYSLARITWALGQRERALEALNAIAAKIAAGRHTPGTLPFLAVSERFEHIAPGDAFGEWCVASVLEQRERVAAYSSYFQDETTLDSLEMIARLPFQGAEMERRRQLLRIRLGRQQAPEPTPLLTQRRDDNLNPALWSASTTA